MLRTNSKKKELKRKEEKKRKKEITRACSSARPNPADEAEQGDAGGQKKILEKKTHRATTGQDRASVCATLVLADVPALLPRRVTQDGMPGYVRK